MTSKKVKAASQTYYPNVTQLEELATAMADSSPIGMYIVQEGKFTFINSQFQKCTGYDKTELLGSDPLDIIHPEDRERVRKNAVDMLKRQRSAPYEFRCISQSGEIVWALETVISIYYNGKQAALGNFMDITESKRMEEALRQSEDKWYSLVENAPNIITLTDRDGTIKYMNSAISGFDADDAVGTSIYGYIQPEYHDALRKAVNTVFDTGETDSYEITGTGLDGSISWYETRIGPVKRDGEVTDVIHIVSDITERKQTEREMRIKDSAIVSSINGIAIADRIGNLTYVNPSFLKMWGYDDEKEILGESAVEFWQMQEQAAEIMKTLQEKGSWEGELIATKKDGTRFNTLLSASMVMDITGNPIQMMGSFVDITERKQVEEALRESEEKLHSMFQSVNDGIAVTDLEGTITDCNEKAVNLYGANSKEEILGRNALEFVGQNDREKAATDIMEIIAREALRTAEYNIVRDDGSIYDTEVTPSVLRDLSGNPIGIIAIIRDVTERKRAERELRIKDSAITSSVNGIAIADLTGNLTYVNPSLLRMWGYDSEAEVLGKSAVELWQTEEDVFHGRSALMKKGSWIGELVAVRKDGSTFDAQLSANLVRDDYGNSICVMASFTDITERKRMEEVLREQEKKLQTMFDSANDAITLIDLNGNIVEANDNALQILGLDSRDELLGKSNIQFVAPKDRETAIRDIQHVLQQGSVQGVQYSALRKDGSEAPVELNASLLKGEDGNPTGIIGVIRDITERKRMEEVVQASRRRYRDLADLLPQTVYEMDVNGYFTFTNREGLRSHGYTPEDITEPMNAVQVFIPEERDSVSRNIQRILDGEELGGVEYTALRKDGSTYPVITYAAPIIQGDNTVGLRGVTIDITERKEMEHQLQEKNEQLDAQNEELQSQADELTAQKQELEEKTSEVERANQLKSEFLANMSHELRTPLNVITGFSELMADEVPGAINEEQRQCLSDILISSKNLLKLINGVLDLSKIESGRIALKLEQVALPEVVDSLSRAMMPIVTQRQQSLDVEIEEGLPLIYTDADKLGQVLLNLVENASKYTPNGGKLRVRAVRDGDWCQVSVIDDGVGIKKEDRERVFEPFCRLDEPQNRDKSGTGLGLALVKEIVEKYGGRIWVESEYGQGSQFIFTLPLAASSARPERENQR